MALKRSGFRKKTYQDVLSVQKARKTAKKWQILRSRSSKKTKKTPIKKMKEQLWELCRQIIFLKHGNTCYTTGATGLEGINLQCGHGKPKGALPLKYQYDLRNLRPQSFRANINLGGMSDIFIAKLEREKEGLEFLQEACVKVDNHWEIKRIESMGSIESYVFIQNKIEEYKKIYEDLLRVSQGNQQTL